MLLRLILSPILRQLENSPAAGIRNVLAELLGSSTFFAPLTHSSVLARGTGSPTYTRATPATFSDFEDVLRTVSSGCARFEGARYVRNFAATTSDDWSNAAYTKFSTSISPTPQPDRDGGTTAQGVIAAAANAAHIIRSPNSGTISAGAVVQVYVIVAPGTETTIDFYLVGSTGARYCGRQFDIANGTVSAVGFVPVGYTVIDASATDAGNGFYICSMTVATVTDTAFYADVYLRASVAWLGDGTSNAIFFDGYQISDITGRTDQTTPSEYVSVGALDYRSEQDPLYLSLPGTAGHRATSPDKAISTGDLSVVVDVAKTDWTPAALEMLMAKDTAVVREWGFYQDAAGIKPLVLFWFQADTTLKSVSSTAAPSAVDGARLQVAATLDADDGAGNYVVKFWQSTNQWATKTQVGATVTVAGVTNIADTAATLYVGDYGGSGPTAGKFYSAKAYEGIPTFLDGAGGETLKVDFNPHRDATTPTGTITSSTTGEVWTLNGASSVVRNATYHGAGVDGVEYFNTDLDGNPLPTEYTYDAVSLNGVAGTYVSTPDSVAASITGDIDIRVKAAANDWSPAAVTVWASKYSNVGQYSWRIYTDNSGADFNLNYSLDGTNSLLVKVSSVTTFANGVTGWLRVTRQASSGKVNFYTSVDGVVWSQLGTEQTGTAGALFDGTDPIQLPNASYGWAGKIYQAQIYNGINGTLAVDFDASRYAGGTTLTGSTGETWTLQGNAVIHPTNNPNTGYVAEGAATNLLLHSNDLSNAAWLKPGPVAVALNAVGIDGAVSAWTVTDDNAGLTEEVNQATLKTAATWTDSCYVKKTTGAQSSYPVLYAFDGATRVAACTIDTTNGVATVWTAYTGFTVQPSVARCRSFNSDKWFVELSFTATAANWYTAFAPAATATATQSTGTFNAATTGSAVVERLQSELGSAATSYTATTTAAVTRNAEIESNSTTGSITAAAGWISLEYTPNHTPSGTVFLWATYVDASNYTAILHDATNLIFRKRIAGVNYDATIANAFVAGTTYKTAASWGAAGTSIALNGTLGTGHANTTAAQIAATMQTGADGNGANQPGMAFRNERIGQRQLSASEMQAVTR